MPHSQIANAPPHLIELLHRQLRVLLGKEVEDEILQALPAYLRWVELSGGQVLMRQGDPGDAMYLLLSGRLRTLITGDDGQPRVVREVTRGQIVGEMSLYTGQPRSATLVAIRDCVLVRLDKADFERLLTSSARLSMAVTRQVVHRLQTEGSLLRSERPVTMGLLAITAGVDLAGFARLLASHLDSAGRVALVDAASMDADLAEPGISARPSGDALADRRIALRLDEIEAAHDFVLLLGDATPTPWTQRCSRHADEVLLLADADQPPALHAVETENLMRQTGRADVAQVLVLLHPAERRCPTGTAAWLARRPVADHVHVRPAVPADMARLARLQSRTAVGLVLAGGGARGLAHLGVWRALQEHGIEIDVVGGTSIGSVMAVYVASDQPYERALANARQAFARNPTGDFNLLPLLSMIKGRRLRRVVSDAVRDMMGFEGHIEDLWKGWFCVATNVTRAREEILRHGPLCEALAASTAIPGALPPVLREGELLCDGGTFNNFPVDVMRTMRGVGRVIGVDLGMGERKPLALTALPGPWAMLLDRLRPPRRRRYRLPSLPSYLINVTVLYSLSRQGRAKAMTDLYINPPLPRIGMLDWRRVDEIVALGHAHAREVLDREAGSLHQPRATTRSQAATGERVQSAPAAS